MVQMLVQGLHSDDQKLIDNVLYQASKQTVVKTTVQRLPMQFVLPLMNKVKVFNSELSNLNASLIFETCTLIV